MPQISEARMIELADNWNAETNDPETEEWRDDLTPEEAKIIADWDQVFNVGMVQAYLDGRKLHTARPVKNTIPLNAEYRGLFWDEEHKNVHGVFKDSDGLST